MNEFVIANVLPGKLNALVKNLMSQMGIEDSNEAVRRINSGEWIVTVPVHRWREENGVIYLTVTSDGTTGEAWITRLECKGVRLSEYTKRILRSKDFKPTSGVTYEVAVLKGSLFSDDDRTVQNIRDKANEMNLTTPNAEVACLIREQFSDKEIEAMGLWYIVAMHEPIKDSGGDPRLLAAHRDGGGRWLHAYYVYPGRGWLRERGFAFLVPQVSS